MLKNNKQSALLFVCLLSILFVLFTPSEKQTTVKAAVSSGYLQYIVPGEESQLFTILDSYGTNINQDAAQGMHAIIAVSGWSDSTTVYYDHYEDGYDFDPSNPSTADETIVVNAGDVHLFESGAIPIPRPAKGSVASCPSASCHYDGGDVIYTAGGATSLTRATWTESGSTLLGLAWELYPSKPFQNSYISPIGEDLDSVKGYADFERVYTLVQATADNTTINFDDDGDGTTDETLTLDLGESSVRSGVQTGATVSGDKPLQVQYVTGSILNQYEARGFTAVPTDLLSNDYYAPVRGANNGAITDIYIYNPNPSTMTVNFEDLTGSGSFTIPAGDTLAYSDPLAAGRSVPVDSAVNLQSTSDFWAISTVDSASSVHDWGYSLVPTELLRNEYYISLAPGSNDIVNNSTGTAPPDGIPDANMSPIFVTPSENNTTVFIDLDLDGTADFTYVLDRLQSQRIFSNASFNNSLSGSRIWATGPIAIAYGQDPDTASGGNPALDLGYTSLPSPSIFMDVVLNITKTANPSDLPRGAGQTATFTLVVSTESYNVDNNVINDNLPDGWNYVDDSTVITLPNSSTITGNAADPTISGQTLTWSSPLIPNLSGNETVTIDFQAITTASTANGNNINQADATGEIDNNGSTETFTASDFTSVDIPPLDISKLSTPEQTPLLEGNTITYTMLITNDGSSVVNNVILTDTLPAGVSYVPNSTSVQYHVTGIEQSVADDLESGGYSGNTGTDNWSNGWQEVSDDGAPGSGDVQNYLLSGDRILLLSGANKGLFRTADLTSYTNALLSFSLGSGSIEGGEEILIQASSNGGSSWTTLTTIPGGTGTSIINLDISSYISNQTAVRFLTGGTVAGGFADYFIIDDLAITYSKDAELITVSGGTPPSLLTSSDNRDLLPNRTMTVTFAATVDNYTGRLSKDLTNSATATSNNFPQIITGTVTNQLGPAGTIGDYVWEDLDGDGIQDAGEIGVENIRIFIDENGNGTFDAGEPNDFTDANGVYDITGLDTGTYTVTIDSNTIPVFYDLTTAATTAVSLTFSQDYNMADFGLRPNGQINGTVFKDDNSNTTQDGGENSVANIPITLYSDTNGNGIIDGPDVQLETTTTSITGTYSFNNLPVGDFIVQIDNNTPNMPPGYISSLDSTPVTLTLAQNSQSADFPLMPVLSKTVNQATANVGDTLTFTIIPQYPSSALLTNVVITDTIPIGTTYVPLSANAGGTQSGGIVTWNLGSNSAPIDGYQEGSTPGSVTINANRDNWLDEDQQARNNGADTQLLVSPRNGRLNRPIIGFDLSTIPAGATINTAILRLEQTDVGNNAIAENIEVRALTQDWQEGTEVNSTGISNWLVSDINGINSIPWTNAGGDINSTIYATTNVPTSLGPVDWDVATLVQEWVDGSLSNFGLLLRDVTEDGGSKEEHIFSSREGGTPPQLIITYSVGNGPDRGTNANLSPTLVSDGTTIQLTMNLTATNTVTNVTPIAPTPNGINGASASCGSATPASQDVPAGSGASFTWQCTVSSGADPGSITFDVGATAAAGFSFPTATSNSTLVIPALTFQATVDTIPGVPVITNTATIKDAGIIPLTPSNTTETALTGSIGDFVWADLDGDGTQDAGEPGLGGVTVFIDSNGNGSLDAGEPNDTTDNDGAYHIYGLDSNGGSPYTVTLNPATIPTNYQSTTPGSLSVTLASDTEQYTAADFGLRPPGTATIGDTVWIDTDADGIVDGGETILENITLTLYQDLTNDGLTGDDLLIKTTSTDASGNYLFDALNDGNYLVVVDETSVITTSQGVTSTVGAAMTLVSGTNPHDVTLAADQAYDTADFGYNWNGSIGDLVWEDSNGDGIKDVSESGIISATVYFDTNNNGIRDAGEPFDITDANGAYSFTALPPGTYTVTVESATLPTDFSLTTANQPLTVNLGAGETVDTADFGYRAEGTVFGHLFEDTNGNGTQDAGEPNLNGITVLITDSLGITQTVTTDASGNYTATVPVGSTTADVDETTLPAGYVQTAGVDPSTVTAVSNTATNIGDDGYQPQNATIGDFIWTDVNADGVQDPIGEPGINGVIVYIDLDGDGIRDAGEPNATTDSDGLYDISGLAPSTYTVTIDAATLPPFYKLTTTDPLTVSLAVSQDYDLADFGYQPQGQVTGHLYEDIDGNGTQDPGEPNLPNVSIVITDSLGFTQTVTTDVDGNYLATVLPGSATVDIVDSTLPPNSSQTEGDDPTSVVVTAGVSTDAGNDGFQILAIVVGHIFEDTDGNGTQDAGEPNLSGIDVVITDKNGITQTVTTDASGNYTTTVPAGTTTANIVEATLPSGYIQTAGTDPTTITAVSNATTSFGDDGYQPQAEIFGHIFEDTNGNGTQDAGEPNLSGIDVIITGSDSVTQTVTTDASGNYTATVPPGSTTANIVEANLPAGYVQTAGVDPSTVTAVANASTSIGDDGYQPRGDVFGHIFEDSNGNGSQDAGEPNLANIDVLITDSLGVTQTVTTDASGNYTATVPAGSTTANVDETTLPTGYAQTAGVDPSTVTAVSGASTDIGIDGYRAEGLFTGHIFEDANGNGIQDAGEPNLSGIDLVITDSLGITQTVTTDASGNYTATVPAGATTADVVDSTLPAGYVLTAGTDPNTATVPAGGTAVAPDVGYQSRNASIGDFVWTDVDADGIQDAIGEPGIANVVVYLDLDGDGIRDAGEPNATTDSDGLYDITGLAPGTYTVTIDAATLPPMYKLTTTDPLTVTLSTNQDYDDADFGYQPQGQVDGHIYEDVNGNGTQDPGEPNLPNVSVVITDSLGFTQTVTTDVDGNYTATVLPGTATVDIVDSTLPPNSTQTEGDDPTSVVVTVGVVTNAGDDGFQILAVVFGHLFEDTNGNGTQDAGEPNLTGIDVVITDTNSVVQTVTTDASGNYTSTVPAGNTTADVDETTLPAGYNQTAGADPTTITAVSNATTSFGDDGYQPQGDVFGNIFEDTNGNGTQDAGEPPLNNVSVVITDSFGTVFTATTDASGFYTATIGPGLATVDVDETTLPPNYNQTAGVDPSTVTAVANASTNAGSDGFQLQGTLFGYIFEDSDGNGSSDVGEPPFASVTVLITDSFGITHTAVTDVSGYYTASLPAGNVTADVDETTLPPNYLQTAGVDQDVHTISVGATIDAGIDGYQPQIPSIGDRVWSDINGDGVQDAGEPGIENVRVYIDENNNGVYDATEPFRTTSASGFYDFAGIITGTYTVTVDALTVPSGFILTTPDTLVRVITAVEDFNDVDFGYQPFGTIFGHLFEDTNANGIQDAGEPNLNGVDVFITDSLGVTQTVTTDASGNYTATVAAGDTTADVVEATLPAGAVQTAGADPTTVTVPVGSVTDAGNDGYQLQGDVFGHIFQDSNGNGTQDAGEPNLSGIDVIITDSLGIPQTVTTDASGNYTATVPVGTTSANVVEATLPAGYTQTAGVDPSTVTAVGGASTSIGEDGYQPQGQLTGHIFEDTNGNGTQDAGEPNLANVDVLITDSEGVTQTVTTDASGNYTATVAAGSTTANVVDSTLPAGYILTAGTDPQTVNVLLAGTAAAPDVGYQPQGDIFGHIFEDTNGNGSQDAGEPNLNNIDVLITDSLGVTQTVTTDASGNYTATVPAGSTTANIDETTLPAGYVQTAGVDPSTVTAVSGASTSIGNDGYQPQGDIFGHIFEDTNDNGVQDAGEPNLNNVDVLITDTFGVTQTVTTDASGNYTATVPAGSTTANIDEATLPAGYVHTAGTDPTTVTVPAGSTTDGGDDGYQPQGDVFGHIYEDTNGNGSQDAGEPNLSGIDVIITNTFGVTQTVTTDASGNYTATVPAGSTTANIDETTLPAGYVQTAGADPSTVTAVSGASTDIGDDGYQPQGDIFGHIFEDTNGNGSQDAGEPNLNGIDVIITDSLGVTQTVTTDASGNYTATVLAGSTTANIVEATLPAGYVQTAGADPSTVTAVAGASTDIGDDGYQPQGDIFGHIFDDTNGNGSQDAGEPNLSGIDVIITDSLGVTQTVTTDASGNYTATIPAGSTTANIVEATLPAGYVQTAGVDPSTVTAVSGASTDIGDDGYQPQGQITGHLFQDTDGDGIQDPGEPNLSGVTLIITDSLGITRTVTTDANGNYTATVPAGNTTTDVDETTLPAGLVLTTGSDPDSGVVPAGGTAVIADLGYQPQNGTIGDFVWSDTNGDGVQDGGEAGLAGVRVFLDLNGNGLFDAGEPNDTTNGSGGYDITNLPPGTYTVTVDLTTLGAGYNLTTANNPTAVTLAASQDYDDADFGFQPTGQLFGHIFEDSNGNGTQDAGEPNLNGVDVLITDSLGVTQTITTDASGNYTATVPAGNTTADVVEATLPAGATQTAGVDPSSVNVPVGSSTDAGIDGYQLQAEIFGHIFEDTNGNGTQDVGEVNLSGINIVITNSLGVAQTVTTDGSGNYTANVPAGNTTANIVEATLPAGYVQTAGADPSTVTAVAGTSTDIGNDGYQPQGELYGHIFEDSNGNGTQDAGEPNLNGIDVIITDNLGATQTVTTDASGNYTATVPAGSTTVDVDNSTLPFGYEQTAGADPTSLTVPSGASINAGNDGYQPQGIIFGHLFEDVDGDGIQDPGEPNLSGIDVVITDVLGIVQTVTTDASGNYTATVPAGNTTADVDETTLPAGSVQTAGNDPSSVTAVTGVATDIGTDGYQRQGTVYGYIFEDTDGDGFNDIGEPPLNNISIVITDSLGITQTVTTDASGNYTATVPIGTTTADVDETTLPLGYTHTSGVDPSTVTAVAGSQTNIGTDGYQPSSATIGDYVWEDTNGDGVQDAGENGIQNVTVYLDLNGNGSLDAGEPNDSTDATGAYDITGLSAGTYTVTVDSSTLPAGSILTGGTEPLTVTVTAVTDYNDADFGYQPQGDVFGHIFEDTNGNGVQDAGEPNLNNVSVVITNSLGVTQTVTTDASGNYTATVPAGSTTSNIVEATLPAGVVQTAGVDPSTVTAVAGASTDIGDDGYQRQDASIGDFVWTDADADGIQDAIGEPGIQNVVVYLDLNGNGVLDGGEPNATTDGNGAYDITGLAAGTYTVTVDASTVPAMYKLTTNDPLSVTITESEDYDDADFGYQPQGQVTGHIYEDTDGNGTQDVGEPNLSGVDVVITDTLGFTQTVTTDVDGNYVATVLPGSATVDVVDATLPAGYVQTEGTDPTNVTVTVGVSTDAGDDGYAPSGASIGDYIWEDTDGDGVQDAGESGIQNVTVYLDLNGNGVLDGGEPNDTTDATGAYDINSLSAGTYTVTVDATTIPAGFVLTGGIDPLSVTLANLQDHDDADFGYQPQGDVFGHIFEDSNGNGSQDAGEPNLSNIDVIITDSLGMTQTVTTDASGNYTATVPVGSTTSNIVEATLPAGSVQTAGVDPSTVTAVAGASTSIGNDGYQPQGQIIGHLFEDTNGNGIQDAGEPNLNGVSVIITDSLGITQTVTSDPSGNYTATIPTGNTAVDIVDATLPAGLVLTAGNDPDSANVTGGGTAVIADVGYQPQNGSIGDIVWSDDDGDGIQDGGEAGLAGVTVYLDLNGNGVLDGGEPSDSTDGAGAYDITGLAAGTYTVIIDAATAPAGTILTTGNDPLSVTLTAGQDYADADFGYQANGTIFGHIFEDTNGNGVQDAGEPNLNNIDVVITDSLGVTQTVTTDASGNYTTTVPAGSTAVNIDEATLPLGSAQTAGADPESVNVAAGSNTDAGNDGYQQQGDVFGHIFEDVNGNGIQDAGESNFNNIDVLITDAFGVTQTVTTDASGNYTASVSIGTVQVDVDETTLPPNYNQTAGVDPTTVTAVANGSTDAGNDGYQEQGTLVGFIFEDSNGNGSFDAGDSPLASINVIITDSFGLTQTVTTDTSGNYTTTLPAGNATVDVDETTVPTNYLQTAGSDPDIVSITVGATTDAGDDGYQAQIPSIGDLVWSDTNGDGVQDPGELGIGGVTVYLDLNNNGVLDGGEPSQVTSGTGFYDFAGLANGTYTVTVDATSVPSGYIITTPNSFTRVVTGIEDYDDADFGYQPFGELFGHIFEDTNGNGTQDAGEPNLNNVTVLITDSLGITQTVTTDASGNYTATVAAGNTAVDVDETTLPIPATQTAGTDPTTVNVPVGSSTDAGNDGYQPIAAVVFGHIFEDTDGNGIHDPGEPNLSGVSIVITDSLGITQTVTTDPSGNYTATVPAGNAIVDVVEATLPPGSQQTAGSDPTAVTITPGDTVDAGDDGFQPVGTVTGHIFNDLDGDGIQDPGEPNMGGIDIVIVDSLGMTQTVTTDPSGNYTATVPPGTVTADVVDGTVPPGFVLTGGSDPATINIPAGSTTPIPDIGYQQQNASIGDLVWSDLDADGIRDGGEPGIGNVTLALYEDSNGNGVLDAGEPLLDTQTTAGDGSYEFTALPAGDYLVVVTDQNNALMSFELTGGSDPAAVSIVAGEDYDDADFGYFELLTLGNQIWLDADGDGIFDPAESGAAAGIRLSLLDENGDPVLDGAGQPIQTTTDANGQYMFTDLYPGEYMVQIDASNFQAGGALEGFTSTDGSGGDPDDDEDGDDNGLDSDPTIDGIRSAPITLAYDSETLGDEDGDGNDNTNFTVDFGLNAEPTAVTLLYFNAVSLGGGIVQLTWETAEEVDNFGFRLYRSDLNDFSTAQEIHFEPSGVAGGTGPGASYRYEDDVAGEGTFYYWLVDVETDGDTAVSGSTLVVVNTSYNFYLPFLSNQ